MVKKLSKFAGSGRCETANDILGGVSPLQLKWPSPHDGMDSKNSSGNKMLKKSLPKNGERCWDKDRYMDFEKKNNGCSIDDCNDTGGVCSLDARAGSHKKEEPSDRVSGLLSGIQSNYGGTFTINANHNYP